MVIYINEKSDIMKIHKQTEVMEFLYITHLDNGVIIGVQGDHAIGTDGKTYYHVGEEKDGMIYTVGWSSEIDKALII